MFQTKQERTKALVFVFVFVLVDEQAIGNVKSTPLCNLSGTAIVDLNGVSELRVFKENEMFWEFGAGLRISEMLDIFKAMPDEEPLNTQVKAFRDVLSRFSHLL